MYRQAYQAVHVLVTLLKSGEDVYGKVKLSLEKFVDAAIRELIRVRDETTSESFKLLQAVVSEWSWFESRLVR
jgi:hypothetical protein